MIITDEMQYVQTLKVVYRMRKTLTPKQLDALYEWLQEQPSETFGLGAQIVQHLKFYRRNHRVLEVEFAFDAPTAMVKHVIGMVATWVEDNLVT